MAEYFYKFIINFIIITNIQQIILIISFFKSHTKKIFYAILYFFLNF